MLNSLRRTPSDTLRDPGGNFDTSTKELGWASGKRRGTQARPFTYLSSVLVPLMFWLLSVDRNAGITRSISS